MTESESIKIICRDLADTKRVGGLIGECLRPGVTIALQGTLGAGKTNLVQAIAESLNVDRKTVVSPTFTMIQVHRGRLTLVHIDAYRIADEDEFFELGIDEYLENDSVVAMEWAEKFSELLPMDRLEIAIEVVDETVRNLTISWPASESTARETGHAIRTGLA